MVRVLIIAARDGERLPDRARFGAGGVTETVMAVSLRFGGVLCEGKGNYPTLAKKLANMGTREYRYRTP